jgi:hypothetical protein
MITRDSKRKSLDTSKQKARQYMDFLVIQQIKSEEAKRLAMKLGPLTEQRNSFGDDAKRIGIWNFR